MPVPRIEFHGVSKSFADVRAIADLDLTVHDGEVFVLLGASGCGKSTALQLVNRMLDPDAGRIVVSGSDTRSWEPVELRRSIGYVIQQIGLFPHRTVFQNIATVCSLLGWSSRETSERVTAMLELVGLDPVEYARRYPHELSGGQQQRVGVARALAGKPQILLMDEPFGALDPQIRRELQAEFRRWVSALGTTVMFVTHDVDEAIILADRIAVLGPRAQPMQIGRPVDLLGRPATEEVADFLGADRTIKRLNVLSCGAGLVSDTGSPCATEVPSTASAYEALIALMDSPDDRVAVIDPRGIRQGMVTWPSLAGLARTGTEAATSPSFPDHP